MKNFDSYYDSPDEPEAVFCEFCGKEMVEIDNFGGQRDMKCINDFCPEKFSGVVQEMAYELVDAWDDLDTMTHKYQNLRLQYDDLVKEFEQYKKKSCFGLIPCQNKENRKCGNSGTN